MPSLNNSPVITPLPRTDLRAIPDAHINGSSSSPSDTWTYDANSRTTRARAPEARNEDSNLVVPAVYSAPATKAVDDSGWRAARR